VQPVDTLLAARDPRLNFTDAYLFDVAPDRTVMVMTCSGDAALSALDLDKIQVCRGFVGQDQRRVQRDRAGNRHPLFTRSCDRRIERTAQIEISLQTDHWLTFKLRTGQPFLSDY
jgi:hypothetical protein